MPFESSLNKLAMDHTMIKSDIQSSAAGCPHGPLDFGAMYFCGG